MKKFLMVFLCVLLMLILFFYIFSFKLNIGCVQKQDITEYLHVNDYVEETLHTQFVGIFPSSKKISNQATYYYDYSRVFFGQPNFQIYLKNTYSILENFNFEKKRISNLKNQKNISKNGKKVYVFNFPDQTIDKYLDEKINDGMTFNFEVVIIDENTHTIEYLVAVQQDNNSKSEIVLYIVEMCT